MLRFGGLDASWADGCVCGKAVGREAATAAAVEMVCAPLPARPLKPLPLLSTALHRIHTVITGGALLTHLCHSPTSLDSSRSTLPMITCSKQELNTALSQNQVYSAVSAPGASRRCGSRRRKKQADTAPCDQCWESFEDWQAPHLEPPLARQAEDAVVALACSMMGCASLDVRRLKKPQRQTLPPLAATAG